MDKVKNVYLNNPEWVQRRYDRRYVKKLLTYLTRHKVISWEVNGTYCFENIIVGESISDKEYQKLELVFGRVVIR